MDSIAHRDLLVASASIVDEPHPTTETPVTTDDATETRIRALRDAAANRTIDEYNPERYQKGPRIGHNCCYYEVEARMKAELFYALSNEGDRWITDLI